jgi:hypothetical protein
MRGEKAKGNNIKLWYNRFCDCKRDFVVHTSILKIMLACNTKKDNVCKLFVYIFTVLLKTKMKGS